jgi:exopolysaccharide biosynthesis protein
VNASRAFILTGAGLTVAEAYNILAHFGGAQVIQLDGGGSTQMKSYAGDRLSLLDRHIPNILYVEYAQ